MKYKKLSESELKEISEAGFNRIVLAEGSDHWNEVCFEGEWPNSKTGSNITITEKTIDSMIENFNANVRGLCYKDTGLPTVNWDYGHEAEKEAAGWISQLEKRDKTLPTGKKVKSLWAKNYSWTSAAQAAIKDDVWLFPSVDYDDFTNTVTGKTYKDVLFGVALTNRPAVKYMQSVRLSEPINTPGGNKPDIKEGVKPMFAKLRTLLLNSGAQLSEATTDEVIEHIACEKIKSLSEIGSMTEKKLSEATEGKAKAEKELSEANKKLAEVEKEKKELAESEAKKKVATLDELAKKAYTPAQLSEGKTAYQAAMKEGKVELAEAILADRGVAFKETRKDEGEKNEAEGEDEADMSKDWDNQSNAYKTKKVEAYMADKKMDESDDKAFNKAEAVVSAKHNAKHAEHKKKAGGKK